MATSVKMREQDKAELDRLQAVLTQRIGRKVSQQDLLHRLVLLAEAHLAELASVGETLSEAEVRRRRERLFHLPEPSGLPPLDHDAIDDIVTGDGG